MYIVDIFSYPTIQELRWRNVLYIVSKENVITRWRTQLRRQNLRHCELLKQCLQRAVIRCNRIHLKKRFQKSLCCFSSRTKYSTREMESRGWRSVWRRAPNSGKKQQVGHKHYLTRTQLHPYKLEVVDRQEPFLILFRLRFIPRSSNIIQIIQG